MSSLIGQFPQTRLRRLRAQPLLRALISPHALSLNDLVLPLFIKHGQGVRQPIASMPGHNQLSVDQLGEEIKTITQLGIKAVILFGIPAEKDGQGRSSWSDEGIVQQAIRYIKSQTSDLLVIADVCFCEYTDHGHCGVLDASGRVDNDTTLANLARQAVSLVQAGADVIAPSGMMDGMVQAIRRGLDEAHYAMTPILSYAVKYASAFYGPFRDAAEGAPQLGDRSGYQMPVSDDAMAMREASLDLQEGADMLMVKPAGAYLDIVYRVKQAFPGVPLCAYQVSGEFAMIQATAQAGWIDHDRVMMESLLAIKRAGADFIITYFAKSVAAILQTQ